MRMTASRCGRFRRDVVPLATSVLFLSGLPGTVRCALAERQPAPLAGARVPGQENAARRIMPLLEKAEQRTMAGHLSLPIDASAATLLVELATLVPNSPPEERQAAAEFLLRLKQEATQAGASGDADRETDLTVLGKMVASSLDLPASVPDPGLAPMPPEAAASASEAEAGDGAGPPRLPAAEAGMAALQPPAAPPSVPGQEIELPPGGAPVPEAPAAQATPPLPGTVQDASVEGETEAGKSGLPPGPPPPEAPVASASSLLAPAARDAPGDAPEPQDAAQAPPDSARRSGADPVAVASLTPWKLRSDVPHLPMPPFVAAPPAPAPTSAPSSGDPGAPDGASARIALAPSVVAVLMRRGAEMVAIGDISGARRLYERAALAGDADAATAAGRMYDPDVLVGIHAQGIRPDPEMARHWYRWAMALGAPAPATRLQARVGAPADAGGGDAVRDTTAKSPGPSGRRGEGPRDWRVR